MATQSPPTSSIDHDRIFTSYQPRTSNLDPRNSNSSSSLSRKNVSSGAQDSFQVLVKSQVETVCQGKWDGKDACLIVFNTGIHPANDSIRFRNGRINVQFKGGNLPRILRISSTPYLNSEDVVLKELNTGVGREVLPDISSSSIPHRESRALVTGTLVFSAEHRANGITWILHEYPKTRSGTLETFKTALVLELDGITEAAISIELQVLFNDHIVKLSSSPEWENTPLIFSPGVSFGKQHANLDLRNLQKLDLENWDMKQWAKLREELKLGSGEDGDRRAESSSNAVPLQSNDLEVGKIPTTTSQDCNEITPKFKSSEDPEEANLRSNSQLPAPVEESELQVQRTASATLDQLQRPESRNSELDSAKVPTSKSVINVETMEPNNPSSPLSSQVKYPHSELDTRSVGPLSKETGLGSSDDELFLLNKRPEWLTDLRFGLGQLRILPKMSTIGAVNNADKSSFRSWLRSIGDRQTLFSAARKDPELGEIEHKEELASVPGSRTRPAPAGSTTPQEHENPKPEEFQAEGHRQALDCDNTSSSIGLSPLPRATRLETSSLSFGSLEPSGVVVRGGIGHGATVDNGLAHGGTATGGVVRGDDAHCGNAICGNIVGVVHGSNAIRGHLVGGYGLGGDAYEEPIKEVPLYPDFRAAIGNLKRLGQKTPETNPPNNVSFNGGTRTDYICVAYRDSGEGIHKLLQVPFAVDLHGQCIDGLEHCNGSVVPGSNKAIFRKIFQETQKELEKNWARKFFFTVGNVQYSEFVLDNRLDSKVRLHTTAISEDKPLSYPASPGNKAEWAFSAEINHNLENDDKLAGERKRRIIDALKEDTLRDRLKCFNQLGDGDLYWNLIPRKKNLKLTRVPGDDQPTGWGIVIDAKFNYPIFVTVISSVVLILSLVLCLGLSIPEKGPLHGNVGGVSGIFFGIVSVLALVLTWVYNLTKEGE